MTHVQRVNWFQRDPGGTTVYVLPDPEQADEARAAHREELGLEPGESDPARALGVVLLIFAVAVAVVAGAVVLIWMLR